MKTLYALALVLGMGHTALGQDQISGIGKFKIGVTTTAVVGELAKEMGSDVRQVSLMSDMFRMEDQKPEIVQLLRHPTDEIGRIHFSTDCKAAKTYYINLYNIANIDIKGIYLRFYQDTLVSIVSYGSSELRDALITKYGKPSTKYDSKEVSCVYYNTGNKLPMKEESILDTWKSGDITALYSFSKTYDDNCKERLFSTVWVESVSKREILADCTKSAEKQHSDAAIEDKKKALKDF